MKSTKAGMMSAEDFGAAIALAAGANSHSPSPQEIGLLSADVLQSRYRELFATLDMNELSSRLFAWVRVNAPTDTALSIPDQLAWSELGVYELITRGVIIPKIETSESKADLAKLCASVKKSNLRPPASEAVVEATPAPVALSRLEQCVQDYLTTQSSDFRKKWMTTANRPIYEQAAVDGGPIDQAVKAAQNYHGIGRA